MPRSVAQVGEPAVDFQLEGTSGRFRLGEHRGERVVLLFYTADRGMVCTRQFRSYAARGDDLDALGATVVGISGQDTRSHDDFQARYDIPVPLLADPDLTVARAYGVWAPVAGTRRAVVVVDEDGIVRHRHVHTIGFTFATVDDLRRVLDAL